MGVLEGTTEAGAGIGQGVREILLRRGRRGRGAARSCCVRVGLQGFLVGVGEGSEPAETSEEDDDGDGGDGKAEGDEPEGGGVGLSWDSGDVDAEEAGEEGEWEEDGGDDGQEVHDAGVAEFALGAEFFLRDCGAVADFFEVFDEAAGAVDGFEDVGADGWAEGGRVQECGEGVALGGEVSAEGDGVAADDGQIVGADAMGFFEAQGVFGLVEEGLEVFDDGSEGVGEA